MEPFIEHRHRRRNETDISRDASNDQVLLSSLSYGVGKIGVVPRIHNAQPLDPLLIRLGRCLLDYVQQQALNVRFPVDK